MPEFKVRIGKHGLEYFKVEQPDGVGSLEVWRDDEDKINATWKGEDATVKSVLDFIKSRYGNLGDMFPGIDYWPG